MPDPSKGTVSFEEAYGHPMPPVTKGDRAMNKTDKQIATELLTAVEDYLIAFVVTLTARSGGQDHAVRPELRERVIDTLAAAVKRADENDR